MPMQYVGSLDVLQAMQLKRRLQKNGQDHEHIRIALIISGGGIAGIFAGVFVAVLQKLGFGKVFDWVIGFSTGAPIGAYFLSEQADLGCTIYSEECCSRQFFNLWRFWRPINTNYIMSVFRAGPKRLVTETVFAHPTKFVVGITDYATGEQVLRAPQDKKDLFDLVHASLAIPGVSSGPILIDGKQFGDGYFPDPLPVATIIEQYQPTHILVVLNGPLVSSERYDWLTFELLYGHRIPAVVKRTLRRASRLLNQQVQEVVVQAHGVPVGMAAAGSLVPLFTRDSKLVKIAAEKYNVWWTEIMRSL